MPPRKSTDRPARRSDLSDARFLLTEKDMDGDSDPVPIASTTTLGSIAPAPAEAAPTAEAHYQHYRNSIDMPSTPAADSGSPPPSGTAGDGKKRDDAVTIEDLTLPKSIVTRLAKGVLPPNTQIQANAILGMTKSASVFISHLANAANEITQGANKKTIMPDDVFNALDDTEFGFMRPLLEAEYQKYSQTQTSKRSTYRKRVAAEKRAAAAGANVSTLTADESGVQGDVSTIGDNSHLPSASTSSVQRGFKAANAPRRGGGNSSINMDVDDAHDQDGGEVEVGGSDADTVPEDDDNEPEEEDEVEEEADEEEDDQEDDDEQEDGDRMEEREDGADDDDDEALGGDESE